VDEICLEKLRVWNNFIELQGFQYMISIQDRLDVRRANNVPRPTGRFYQASTPNTPLPTSQKAAIGFTQDQAGTLNSTPSKSKKVAESFTTAETCLIHSTPTSATASLNRGNHIASGSKQPTFSAQQQPIKPVDLSEVNHQLPATYCHETKHLSIDSTSDSAKSNLTRDSSLSAVDTKESLDTEISIVTDPAKEDKVELFSGSLPPLPPTINSIFPRDFVGKRLLQAGQDIWVETEWQLDLFLRLLPHLEKNVAQLFNDQEGNEMCRYGTMSYVQITFAHINTTFILDCYLGQKLFDKTGPTGLSLRHVLEDPDIPKLYFDVRNDSDAVFAFFKVRLQGVIDLQIMEIACRGPMNYCGNIRSLQHCIEKHLQMDGDEFNQWKIAKLAGKGFCRTHGWATFDIRPLPTILAKYAAQDTKYMPHLYNVYREKMKNCPELCALVKRESQHRANSSQDPEYDPQPQNAALVEHLFVPDSFLVPWENSFYLELVKANLKDEELVPDIYRWHSSLKPELQLPIVELKQGRGIYKQVKGAVRHVTDFFGGIKNKVQDRIVVWKAKMAQRRWDGEAAEAKKHNQEQPEEGDWDQSIRWEDKGIDW
jgi:exonuclease 3'-5' domain-containing protein 1